MLPGALLLTFKNTELVRYIEVSLLCMGECGYIFVCVSFEYNTGERIYLIRQSVLFFRHIKLVTQIKLHKLFVIINLSKHALIVDCTS